ncbi:hypothetical protein TorRG33x02_102700 [Trema orientale]|uniref:Uncharacterized protein n=1 Tax=Trema orientale TaxID=63057 RepID=A0A2P5F7U8_TREOI|nr:hypothetical protein TorRG33x02_102700 [Trema orientale]
MHDLREANKYCYTILHAMPCHDVFNYLEKKVIHEQIPLYYSSFFFLYVHLSLLIWAMVFQNSNLNIFHCLQLELGGTSTENIINNNSLNIYVTDFISPFFFLRLF